MRNLNINAMEIRGPTHVNFGSRFNFRRQHAFEHGPPTRWLRENPTTPRFSTLAIKGHTCLELVQNYLGCEITLLTYGTSPHRSFAIAIVLTLTAIASGASLPNVIRSVPSPPPERYEICASQFDRCPTGILGSHHRTGHPSESRDASKLAGDHD